MNRKSSSLKRLAALLAGLASLASARAGNILWTGAGSNSSPATLNWSASDNWSGGTPAAAASLNFFDPGAAPAVSNTDNIVDSNNTVLGWLVGNTNGYHTTLINPGLTLTVSNNAAAFTNLVFIGTQTDNGAGQMVAATVTGSRGTLVVTDTNAGSALIVQQGAVSAGGHLATWDLSGLGAFKLVAGRLLVAGDPISGVNAFNRLAGTLLLAQTNVIQLNGSTTPALDVGDATSNAGTGTAALGQTNSLYIDTLGIGRQKSTGTLKFNPALTGNNPALYLRGKTGGRVVTLTIGDDSTQSTSGSGAVGTVDLSLGTVDAQVTTCNVAVGQTSTGTGTATGMLTLSNGIFNVNTLNVATVSSATAIANVTGTVNVFGTATLVVNTSFVLGNNPGAPATAIGTLNIIDGSVLANTITSTAGAVNSTINLTDGLLAVTNAAGTPAAPIGNFTASDSLIALGVGANTTNLVVQNLTVQSTTNNTINILALPPIYGYPAQFHLISYANYSPVSAADFLPGTLPAANPPYSGCYLSNNVANNTLDLVITAGPVGAPPRALAWNGNLNGNWNTTSANWLNAGSGTTYNQNDNVQFDDTATGTTTVILTTNLTPGSLVVSNNTKAYTFTGPGGLAGATGLTLAGAGSLTLANSGSNTFTGPIALNAGTLIYNLTGTNTEAHSLNGSGAVVMNSPGTLTLAAANSFSGGLIANAGTLRLGGAAAAGNSAVTVNPGASLVLGAAMANALTLSNATLGGSAGATISGNLTVPAGTTNTLYTSDPQNLNTLANLALTGVLYGRGNLNILAGTNPTANPDNTSGAWRFNGTTDGGYNGTITLGNGVKAEIMTAQAGPFSQAANALLVLTCGPATGGGANQNGSYCNLLVRNNSSGNTILGNNVQLAGTGLAAINPLGTAPAGSATTMGNLNIGNGQALAAYRNGGNVYTLVFPTVSLTGGTATFSPLPFEFANSVNGSDLALGNLTQTSPSSLVLDGLRTLTITGTANYTGSTTVSNGTLDVEGTLASTGAVKVATGTLAGAGIIAGPLTVSVGGTLAPGLVTTTTNVVPTYGLGTLTINNNLTLAGNVLINIDEAQTPSNSVVSVTGKITYGGTLSVTNVDASLPISLGDRFQVFPAGGTGNFSAILGSPAPGLAWGFNPATGVLTAVTPPPPGLTVAQSGNTLTLSWLGAGYKLQAQTNNLGKGLSTNWSDYPGGASSPVIITNNPANPATFFQLAPQ